MSHAADSPVRRRRWPLFLPFVLVVLLAVAWTAVWFYAAGRAQDEIAAWRGREAKAGRTQDCASQSIAGYPFRLEVRCGGASFELKGTPTLRLNLPSVLAAVQVYDPKLLISEFTSPLEISEPGRPSSTIVDWRLGQASVRGLPAGIERASLVLDAPTVRDAGGGGGGVCRVTGGGLGAAWAAGRRRHSRQSRDRDRPTPQRRRGGQAPSAGGKADRCGDRDRAAGRGRHLPQTLADAVAGMAGARRPARDRQRAHRAGGRRHRGGRRHAAADSARRARRQSAGNRRRHR